MVAQRKKSILVRECFMAAGGNGFFSPRQEQSRELSGRWTGLLPSSGRLRRVGWEVYQPFFLQTPCASVCISVVISTRSPTATKIFRLMEAPVPGIRQPIPPLTAQIPSSSRYLLVRKLIGGLWHSQRIH